MKRAITTIAATITALIFGGLMINPASAAVKDAYRISEDAAGNFYRWSDISALTHGLGSDTGNALQTGRIEGFYKWSDRNFKQSDAPSALKPVGKSAASFYKWSDINAVTSN